MKYNRKSVFSLFIFLGMLFSCTRAPQLIVKDPSASKIRLVSERAKDSIVQVRSVRKSGKLARIGSGFFVARDEIATSFHNVADKNLIFAKLTDKDTILEVEGVTAFDFKNDLVILKVSGVGVPFSLGDSDAVEIGELVSTLGYPEAKYNITEGIIYGITSDRELFSVKAEYVGGLSGGPVLNRKGEVIGVATHGSGTYGVAVASNALKFLLAQSDSTEPLEQFRKRDPVRAYTHVGRGDREIFRGDYIGAIGAFDKAIELYPAGVDIYASRGHAKCLLGASKGTHGNIVDTQNYYNEAIADFNKVLNEAIADFNKVIELSPDGVGSPEGYGGGEIFRFLGYAKTKVGELENTKGNANKAQDYYNQAVADFNRAIKLDPEYSSAYSNRGYTKIRLAKSEAIQGNVDKARMHYKAAIEDCTKAIQLSPKYAEDSLMRVYAKLWLELGNVDTYKNRGDAQLYLAESEATQNNTAQAESHYRAAIEDYTETINLKSDHAVAYYSRGLAKQALKLQEAARADFEKAAELNPDVGKLIGKTESPQQE